MKSSAGWKNSFLTKCADWSTISILILVVLSTSESQGASLIHKRSVGQTQNQPGGAETCILDHPCGWEVYDPTTRNHEYYVTSSCVCPAGTKCVMNSDDLAMSAYIYACRAVPMRKSKTRNRAIGGPNSAPPTTTASS